MHENSLLIALLITEPQSIKCRTQNNLKTEPNFTKFLSFLSLLYLLLFVRLPLSITADCTCHLVQTKVWSSRFIWQLNIFATHSQKDLNGHQGTQTFSFGFWGSTRCFSGLISGSMLRACSWQKGTTWKATDQT